jgi:hypothetical protein
MDEFLQKRGAVVAQGIGGGLRVPGELLADCRG